MSRSSTESYSSISSFESAAGENDLTIEIVRDPDVLGNDLNRFFRNTETNQVLYYCDVLEDSKLEIHKGSKYGPVVARSNVCRSHPGATDLQIANARLGHVHHDDRQMKASFSNNGSTYQWTGRKGHSQLMSQTGEVIAEMAWPARNAHRRQTGKLVIHRADNYAENLTDPILMTALLVQERADETRSWF
jgi:hypothetical protein